MTPITRGFLVWHPPNVTRNSPPLPKLIRLQCKKTHSPSGARKERLAMCGKEEDAAAATPAGQTCLLDSTPDAIISDCYTAPQKSTFVAKNKALVKKVWILSRTVSNYTQKLTQISLSLFHTKAKTRKELIWGPFAHTKWVAFRDEEYTPTTNCVFLFTRTLRHHSCSVNFPFVANHTRSSAVLPCALEQPKFLDFPNHNFLLSLVDQTFDSTTATDYLFAQATMARESLSPRYFSSFPRPLNHTFRPAFDFVLFLLFGKILIPVGTSTSGPGDTTFSRALSVRNVMSPQWWHIPPYNLRPGSHESLGPIWNRNRGILLVKNLN